MQVEPQSEHHWLQQLVGEWEMEAECVMEPGQPPVKSTGTETVRSLGGLWTVGEGRGEMPGCGEATSLMTLGFDPAKGRFVGSFVASMMTHFWLYDGALDASGKVLTLDAEGPSMTGDGKMARYQDIIELPGDGQRIMRSRMQGADGGWTEFMTARYRRVG
jgi:hypothetical protein